MKKKLINSFITLGLIVSNIMTVYAVADAKLTFNLDCNTINKDVKIGFQSDPTDPNNGPEIIAFEILLSLEPIGKTQITDLENAKFKKNPAYTNMISAQNTSKEISGKREIKFAGGFTQKTGVNNANDLLIITGIKQKKYKITVKDGKLYPKNGTKDIYKESLGQSFVVDTSTCQTIPTPPTQTNTPANTSTATNTGTNQQTSTNNKTIKIDLTSSKNTAKAGEKVTITAEISNSTGSIDWSQTSGIRIKPSISNSNLPGNVIKSELSFEMPTPATDISIKIKTGNTSESITIKGDDSSSTATANTTTPQKSSAIKNSATTPNTDTKTLQERLLERQAETKKTEPSGTIHSVAGSTLAKSGPEDTALLFLISGMILIIYNKTRRKNLEENKDRH